MASVLPALRRNLDLMPSPVPDRPGLLVRDPYRYAEAVLVVPTPLVPCLAFFNGQCDEADLRQALERVTGDARVGEVIDHLRGTLSSSGFLEDETYYRFRDERHRAFADAARRDPAHAGSAYPWEPEALRAMLDGYLEAEPAVQDGQLGSVLGIAAPHVSPEGGWRSYAAAYRALGPELKGRTFVVLGTSHYGDPDRFGLTRKAFLTPYGVTSVALPLVDRLAAEGGPAVRLEDYCHSVEHSIEFQVVFLQHLYGPEVRILPILCGPLSGGRRTQGRPEDEPGVARFLDALRELAAAEGESLVWVLGVDMAHIGRRYGDEAAARAEEGPMADVAARDRARCERLCAADAGGFWRLVQENGDDLRWCGAAPLYVFLRAAAPAGGDLLRYEQWNIDEQSVVSFAGMAFRH
jgi:AmmeMemoRadiSam system protein B